MIDPYYFDTGNVNDKNKNWNRGRNDSELSTPICFVGGCSADFLMQNTDFSNEKFAGSASNSCLPWGTEAESMLENKASLEPIKDKFQLSAGKIGIAVTGGLGIAISIISVSFLSPALRKHCLPYVPATTVQVQNVLSVLKRNPTGKLLDIGSGDGRIVIAASKHGIESHGVEINPWLVLYSKFDAFRQGVSKNVKIFKRNLWDFNLAPYDYVVIFGVDKMMADLEVKIIEEVKAGTTIIACRFPFPNFVPKKIIGSGVDTIWLYEIRR